LQEFPITFNGGKATIQIDDKPRAGVVFKIVDNTIKWKSGQAMPDVNYREYVIGLATNFITKAPWQLQSPDAINNLEWDTFEELGIILGDVFPLERFLSLVGKLMYGKKLELTPSHSETEYTLSSQSGESLSAK